MSNPQVDRWRQDGKFYLWRYPNQSRNYPGWNCTADVAGCQSVVELVNVMLSSDWSSKQEIRLTRPTDSIAALPGLSGTWLTAERLQLCFPGGKVSGNHWACDAGLNIVTLTLGRGKLEQLRDALTCVAKFEGDFCIHADDQEPHGVDLSRMAIWFW